MVDMLGEAKIEPLPNGTPDWGVTRAIGDVTRFSRRPMAFMWHYVRARPWSHAVMVAAVVVAAGCSVSSQYGIKFLIDTLAPGPPGNDQIWFAFALLVSLIAGDNLSWRVAGWIASRTIVADTGDVRADLFGHLMGHAPRYFADRMPGVLTSRITATSNALFTIEYLFMWNVLPPCVATVGAIAYLASVSPVVTAALTVFAGLLVFVLFKFAAKGWPIHRRFADKAATVDGEMTDIVSNMPLVRAFGGFHRERARLAQALGLEVTARRNSLRYIEILRLMHAVVVIAVTVALLVWVITLWRAGGATTGDVVLVCTLAFTILHSTRDLAVALVDMTQHYARLAEALVTVAGEHEIRDQPNAPSLVPRRGNVQFDNVGFAYPDGRAVFSDLNLEIPGGQRVGLVGESGGGKSTLFALLQRFYDVQQGRILIDGLGIASATQESLRAALTIVPQDVSLFHRSVFENIRYGRPDASDAEVRAAAEAARCLEFIEQMPQGFNTLVGERGVKLSTGQRQRIAIARAVLKDAPILLLDEATSALDIDSEEAVREALVGLMHERTVIAIAHRLSTLRDFDRILVLDKGKIVQDGAPMALLRRPGPYRDLVGREAARLMEKPFERAATPPAA
jgi:ATP-binding cassette, subfamily B, bacterial